MNDDGQHVLITPPSAAARAATQARGAHTTVGLDWLGEGLLEAWERYRTSSDQGKSPRERFRPLFEALNWTVSIDVFLREEGEPDDDLRHGLRFARNRVHHQWADALEQRKMYVESSTALIQLTGYSVEWFWKPLHRLPSPPPNRPDRLGSEAYDALLAGREARYALDQLAAWLRERKWTSRADAGVTLIEGLRRLG